MEKTHMLRKTLVILVLLSLVIPLGLATAQFPPPPPGFYTAMADLGVRLGKSFSLSCSNPNDGASCKASDPLLNWAWSENTYENDALGCPNLAVTATGFRKGYVFELTYNNVLYDYRQDQTTGKLSLCSIGGNAAPVQPSSNNGGGQSPQDFSQCPLPPRLTVGAQARVGGNGIPNNMRAEPGQSGAFLGEIPSGASFAVVGGPRCSSNLVWWQVTYNGVTGWTAEGQGGDYWLEPINASPTGQVLLPVNATNVNSLQMISNTVLPAVSTYNGAYSDAARSFVASAPSSELYILRMFDANGTTTIRMPSTAWLVGTFGAWMAVVEPNQTLVGGTIKLFQMSTDVANPATQMGAATFAVGEAQAIAVSNNGSMIAVGMVEQSAAAIFRVEVQITSSGVQPVSLPVSAPIAALAFSPDGTSLRILTSDGFISFYNTTSWQIERSFQTFGYLAGQTTGLASRMVFSANNKYMATVAVNLTTGNSVVQIWDLTANSNIATLEVPKAQKGTVSDVAFSPDGSVLAVGSVIAQTPNGAVDLYAVPTGTFLRTVSTQNVSRMLIDNSGVLHIFINTPPSGQAWQVWAVPQ
jgi:Bacterial SH3 domain